MAKDADHVVKAAIIGLGWWGRIMVDAVQGQSNNMCFTHGAVRNREPVREFAEQRKLMLHSSLDEILALSEIDVVVLATPHSVHVEQIIACAEAGKPVFSEKPLALTLDEAKRAVDACNANGVLLGLGTDRRFLPAMLELEKLVRGGTLGEIINIEGQYSNDNMSQGVSGGWRASAEEAPGAGMTGPGLHVLDSMINLVGPVRSLSGQIYRPLGADIPIDSVSLMLKFVTGVTGLLGCVRGVKNYFRLAVFGTNGRAEMSGFGTLHICLNDEEETVETFSAELAIRETLDIFASAVINSEPFPVSLLSMLNTVAAFETAISSFDREGPQIVPAALLQEAIR